ncbi:protein yippee-like isoform X1 [Beta vulgaris subsp. vulgaris]|uniref:protein yippee-like isoform X1 n=1 Tax=Beta vulgaris subsp. vulgaris TaxID=3555 RepID=UPI000900DFFF|nr:protein yippee-like isoform X1 [Beta vulgaris subsp. vulgaris]XP_019103772.1 protein yippee-like isoform X1 [Beta vulgaris subsp. vulgaris]
MGRLFVVHLEGKIYSCKHCRTHLAVSEDIVSKVLKGKKFDVIHYLTTALHVLIQSFHSRHGKAYLFNRVVNVTLGEKEDRLMMTGMHSVADIFCVGCGSIVGWKYETAHEKSQKYKEGKSVLERYKVFGPDGSNYWVTHEAHVGSSDADDV